LAWVHSMALVLVGRWGRQSLPPCLMPAPCVRACSYVCMCVTRAYQALEAIFKRYEGRVAAFMVEPIQVSLALAPTPHSHA
jgi:adenosylmethionine-8-amino-7-oxononanoate aminotransferase